MAESYTQNENQFCTIDTQIKQAYLDSLSEPAYKQTTKHQISPNLVYFDYNSSFSLTTQTLAQTFTALFTTTYFPNNLWDSTLGSSTTVLQI